MCRKRLRTISSDGFNSSSVLRRLASLCQYTTTATGVTLLTVAGIRCLSFFLEAVALALALGATSQVAVSQTALVAATAWDG